MRRSSSGHHGRRTWLERRGGCEWMDWLRQTGMWPARRGPREPSLPVPRATPDSWRLRWSKHSTSTLESASPSLLGRLVQHTCISFHPLVPLEKGPSCEVHSRERGWHRIISHEMHLLPVVAPAHNQAEASKIYSNRYYASHNAVPFNLPRRKRYW